MKNELESNSGNDIWTLEQPGINEEDTITTFRAYLVSSENLYQIEIDVGRTEIVVYPDTLDHWILKGIMAEGDLRELTGKKPHAILNNSQFKQLKIRGELNLDSEGALGTIKKLSATRTKKGKQIILFEVDLLLPVQVIQDIVVVYFFLSSGRRSGYRRDQEKCPWFNFTPDETGMMLLPEKLKMDGQNQFSIVKMDIIVEDPSII